MAVLAFTSPDSADRNLLSRIKMMKLQSFVVGLIVAFGATMALAQTEPTVAPAGTETTIKPHKKSAKKHAHKVSVKKHKSGKHKKPSVS
jgi:hypothetical protein